jgi:hypothetical protein
MAHLSIRDLQKISGETISTLDGPTPVKAGARTIGVLVPLRVADSAALEAVLKQAEALAAGRDPMNDESFLAEFGDVDPVNWSIEAVDRLKAGLDPVTP